MIVIQQRQRDIGTGARKLFHRAVVDRLVAEPLKDQDPLRKITTNNIVAHRVFIKREIEQPLFLVPVSERQRAHPAPFLDSFRRQQVMAELGEA